jgi:hypothetical protein
LGSFIFTPISGYYGLTDLAEVPTLQQQVAEPVNSGFMSCRIALIKVNQYDTTIAIFCQYPTRTTLPRQKWGQAQLVAKNRGLA